MTTQIKYYIHEIRSIQTSGVRGFPSSLWQTEDPRLIDAVSTPRMHGLYCTKLFCYPENAGIFRRNVGIT
jgi:hypothetical protein